MEYERPKYIKPTLSQISKIVQLREIASLAINVFCYLFNRYEQKDMESERNYFIAQFYPTMKLKPKTIRNSISFVKWCLDP